MPKPSFYFVQMVYLGLVRNLRKKHVWIVSNITHAMQIHVNKDGQAYGPFDLDQLRQYVEAGHFTPQDHAFYEGCQNWITIAQVPGFLPSEGEATAVQESQAQEVAAQAPQAQEAVASAPTQQQQAQAESPIQAAQAPQQAAATMVAADAGTKKKKILLWSGIGGFVVLLGAILFIWSPWSDNKEDKEGKDDQEEENVVEKSPVEEGPNPNDVGKGSAPSDVPAVALLDRIPTHAFGVANVDLEKILEKAGSNVASKLPQEQQAFFGPILKDPSSIGLDVSEPLRIFFLPHPSMPDEDPTMGIAGKLSDSSKLKGMFEQMGLPPADKKDGHDFWTMGRNQFLAVTEDTFLLMVNEDRRAGEQALIKELEIFLNADGSNSFAKAHPQLAEQESKGYDLGIYVDLSNFKSLTEEVLPDELAGLSDGGILTGGIRSDQNELILELNGKAAGLGKALGGGGIPDKLTPFLLSDALARVSLSLDLKRVVELLSDAIESEADLKLDQPIPEFSVSPMEILDVFEGGFALSVTNLASSSEGGARRDAPVTEDEGGGDSIDSGGSPQGLKQRQKNNAQPPLNSTFKTQAISDIEIPELNPPPGSPPDPFSSGNPSPDVSPPDPFSPSGPPPGGPPPGGPLPSDFPEFVLAASIDSAKWQSLMGKYPALAGVLQMVSGFGLSINAENGVLALGSPSNKETVASGGHPKAVTGAAKSIFMEHDLAIHVNASDWISAEPSMREMLKSFESLLITADSADEAGSLSLRLVLSDKSQDSLASLVDFVFALVYLPAEEELEGPGFRDE